MKPLALFTAALLATSSLLTPASAQKHEDKRLGYEIRTPRDWGGIPIKPNEQWIVAKYLSDKSHFFTDPDLKITYEHKPEMQVIAFLSEKYREDEVEVEEDEEEGTIKIRLTNPFEDYNAYLKGTYSGGGFYIAEEEAGEEGDIEVTRYVIKVEKGANGPRRIVTWVFHTEDIDFAVQFECFESAWEDLDSDVLRCLRSFELIERTEGSINRAASTSEVLELTTTKWKDLPAKERRKRRQETERRVHEEALRGLPDDWEVIEEDQFLVLNHGSDRSAENVVEQGEAVFEWCDDTFGYLGEDEYVIRPVIRVCKDVDEEFAFRGGTSWFTPGYEITTHDDKVGIGSWEYRWLNQRFLGYWLAQKDSELMYALPAWMEFGLQYCVQYGKHKGRKFELRPSDWEVMGLRERVDAGLARTPREMFMAVSEEFEAENAAYEAAALMRYLIDGKGSKKRLTRELLEDYYTELLAVMNEIREEEDDKDDSSEPMTEEEEDAMFRARQELWKKRERQIADRLFQRVFAEWDEDDWKDFERDYFKEIS